MDVRGGVGDSWEVGKSFVKNQGWSVLPVHDPQTAQGESGHGFFEWIGKRGPHFSSVNFLVPSHAIWEVEGTRQGLAASEGFGHPLSCSPCRDLSNNQIAEIAPDAFQGLRSLNSL